MEGFCFNGRGIRKRAMLNPPILTRFTSALSNDGSTARVSHTTQTHTVRMKMNIFAQIHTL